MSFNQKTSVALSSLLIASGLIFFDAPLAMACSSGGSSSSGLSHGSSVGSGSVTVCVGSGSSTPSSTTTQTITKTVTVPVKVAAPKKAPDPAPAPVKAVAKPAPAPIAQPVSCPSAAQLASMPKSADAAERWVQSICGTAPKVQSVAKPAPKPAPTPTPAPKTKTKTITETVIIEIPGSYSSSADAVKFYPNPLIISYFPNGVLAISEQAIFVGNPSLHYGSQQVLGRQAEVEFTPRVLSWQFSDGMRPSGNQIQRSFAQAGKYLAVATISYQVRYRLLGETSWQQVSSEVLIQSNTLEVSVGAGAIKGGGQTALLVGLDCEARPASFGCEL